jgi:hypothetical protein
VQKTKHQLRISALIAIAASVWVAHSAGAERERLTVEVGECVDLPTPEQRLACFVAHVEAAREAPEAATPAAPTAPVTSPASAASTAAPATTAVAVPTTKTTAPAEFGFRERPEEREDAAPPEVNAKVAELRETVPNAFLITLDNGQVWRQTRAAPYVSLRVGQDVRIYFSRWRAYRLDSPQMQGFLQVERVR